MTNYQDNIITMIGYAENVNEIHNALGFGYEPMRVCATLLNLAREGLVDNKKVGKLLQNTRFEKFYRQEFIKEGK